MSSAVTSVLSSTVGLLWNKARDLTAAELQDDVTDANVRDAKIRDNVVRELNDFKKRRSCLSRASLLKSYNFLQGGVNLLNISLNVSKPEQQAVLNDIQDDQGETSTMPSAGISYEALEVSNAIGKMKEFESAKEKFKSARIVATNAFWDEELSIKDRIFAAKLRIVSEILECLESPKTAITRCLPFLKKLHRLPVIQKMFSIYLEGRFESRIFNRASRVQRITSVMLINYVLFQLIQKFSSEYSFEVLAWPTIELESFSFHPILHWPK
ncbi:Hypothetical predicted protein, partial [Paramuricea clavata]